MGKKIKKQLKRDLMIHVRVSPDEKKLIEKNSKNYRTLADYIRSKVL